jgi:hypothetical protein
LRSFSLVFLFLKYSLQEVCDNEKEDGEILLCRRA